MKYLGVDYGTKRIGIAVSDEEGGFAFPKAIIANDACAIEKILEVVEGEKANGIVIGYSIATNEKENEAAHEVENFMERLHRKISLPLYTEREDFSSVEAHRYQTTRGSRDDSAAAIILQRFLDKKRT